MSEKKEWNETLPFLIQAHPTSKYYNRWHAAASFYQNCLLGPAALDPGSPESESGAKCRLQSITTTTWEINSENVRNACTTDWLFA